MKKIIIFTVFICCSSFAYSQVLDIYSTLPSATPTNAYLKDSGFQNQFEGTWVYQNGLEYLEVRFVKREMMPIGSGAHQYYEDILLGEYKYIDSNGVLKVNSLSNLNDVYDKFNDYSMYSITKINQTNSPLCATCPPGTERMEMHFSEPANDDLLLSASFVMRLVVENGVEKLKVQFIHQSSAGNMNKADATLPSFFRQFSLPYGEYTLIKL